MNLEPLSAARRSPAWILHLLLYGLMAWARPAAAAPAPGAWSQVDLGPVYQEWVTNRFVLSAWGTTPRSSLEVQGVPFRVGGIAWLLGLNEARGGTWHPPELAAIGVSNTFQALHLLHGVSGNAAKGTPLMGVKLFYRDGEERTLRVVGGFHVAESPTVENGAVVALPDPGSRWAWPPQDPASSGKSRGGPNWVATRLDNPRPSQIVDRIEFLSLFSDASPFLTGLTLEPLRAAAAGTEPAARPGRLQKKAAAVPESVLRRPLHVLVTTAPGGSPVAGAEVFLSIQTDDQHFFLDRRTAGADGRVTLHYPATETISRTLVARAPGYASRVVRHDRLGTAGMPDDVAVELPPGMAGGGRVTGRDGKPIAGVRIVPAQVESRPNRGTASHELAEALTDADGRWKVSSLPVSLHGFQFRLHHPRFSATTFTVQTNAVPVRGNGSAQRWTPEAVLKGEAEAVMSPGEGLAGKVVDEAGKPLPGASIMGFLGADGRMIRLARTDDAGAFEVDTGELEGVSNGCILAEGFAPCSLMAPSEADGNRQRFVLRKPKPFTGLVADNSSNPVPEALVVVDAWQEMPIRSRSALTRADGTFSLEGLPFGNLGLSVVKSNFYRSRMQISWAGGETRLGLRAQPRASGRVLDADTGAPIPDFTVLFGYSYNLGEPMRWQRYNALRGRKGAFSMPLNNYGSQARISLMVEAPGYLPVKSAERTTEAWVDQDFRLKKGKGLAGVVLDPGGIPVAGATVMLMDPGNSLSMESPPKVSRNSGTSDQVRTDRSGRFEFDARLEPGRVVVSEEAGFADIPATNLVSSPKVQLQPWGRVEGVLKLAGGLEGGAALILRSYSPPRYGYSSPEDHGVELYMKPSFGPGGSFTFARVPPGDRQLWVEHRFSSHRNASTAMSHGQVVDVPPGGTSKVVMGGGGRRVTGRVVLKGGDPAAVDWRGDVHYMRSVMKIPSEGQISMSYDANATEEVRQRAQADYYRRLNAYWRSPSGRAINRAQLQLALIFDTNGVFHVDNVPAGAYQLTIAPNERQTDPNSYSYRELGRLDMQVAVPPGGAENEPYDLGNVVLALRNTVRVGGKAPEFEITTQDGKKVTSDSVRGKTVLLYFWAAWAPPDGDLPVLREIWETQGDKGGVVLLMVNLDGQGGTGAKLIKDQSLPGLHAVEPQGQASPLVNLFGLESYPHAVVIGPTGFILAREVNGPSIRSAVMRGVRMSAPAAAAPVPAPR